MLGKIFNHLGIILLALCTSQCLSTCQGAPTFIYDTTNLHLVWQATGTPLDLAGINLAQANEGKICYVPAHKAAYFIDLQGNSWQFSQNTQGHLEVKAIAKLETTFQPREAFAFAAGDGQHQALFIGKLLPQGTIRLWKYDANTWQEIAQTSASIAGLFTQRPPFYINDTTAVAACNWQANDQLHGCLIVTLQKEHSVRNIILAFDNQREQFNVRQPTLTSLPTLNPRIAISPEPNKVLLQISNAQTNGKFLLVNVSGEQVTCNSDIIGDTNNYHMLSAFPLRLEDKISVIDPIFYACKNASYNFLRLDSYNNFISAGDPPPALTKNESLIVPFDQKVYCIAQEKEEEETKNVCYQAKLQRGFAQHKQEQTN